MRALRKRIRKSLKRVLLASQPAAGETWKIAAEELNGVRIRWPKTLQWEYSIGWVEPLFHGFRARVPLEVVEIPQKLPGTVLIELVRGRRNYRVGINCSDYPDLIHITGSAGREEGLALEFKMQFRNAGYGTDDVLPGGFISGSMLVDWYARRARRERDRQSFRWDVYGRFGMQFATEVRSAAISRLRDQSRFRFFGGDRKVGYREFLMEIARSRVCLDLPGNGPFCFRLVDYLAVGSCIVSPPHATTMPVPLVDRAHVVYTRPDMSDLVELCEEYSRDTSKREEIMRNSRDYYQKHLYWRSLSNYYLRTMLDRLPA